MFQSVIYIKLLSDSIELNFLNESVTVQDKAIISVGIENAHNTPSPEGFYKVTGVLAVGSDAEITHKKDTKNTLLMRGFDHPRSFLSDCVVASVTLQELIKKYQPKKYIIRPIIVLHPTYKIEGGITQPELKSLYEIGCDLGRKVFIWVGGDLTDPELKSLNFPSKTGRIYTPKELEKRKI